jgi:predicted ATPase/DNA-binding XRE family transcriptional regulator
MDDDVSFGALLRRHRQRRGMTQQALGRAAGYSTITIRKVESNARRPSPDLVQHLARTLGLDGTERSTFLARAERHPDADLPDAGPSPAARAGLLPALGQPLTPIIGRAAELAALRELLARPQVRLATLVGPPGIGKTRLAAQLAVEVGDRYRDGVVAVALAAISDPRLVPLAMARALGVRESSSKPLRDAIVDHLAGRQALVVLDNLEHLLPAAPALVEILACCPEVQLLATSREALNVRGEHQFAVPALGVPAPGAALTAATARDYAAIELFAERARAVRHDFRLTDANVPDISAICAGVDGVPLAIELVAARMRLLSPGAVLERLDGRLNLLTGGARDLPERQRTLRATIDWSYRLLDADEQALFARLSVFIGGCRPDAAQHVARLDGETIDPQVLLTALVDKSLAQLEDRLDGQPYLVYFQTVREFARERLVERGEEETVLDRFADHYVRLAEAAATALESAEQAAELDRLDAEHDNVRTVIDLLLARRDAGALVRLAWSLWPHWHLRSHQTEGRRWLAAILTCLDAADLAGRARMLTAAGWMAWDQGDFGAAAPAFEEGLALFRRIGDRRGVAGTLHGVGAIRQLQDPLAAAACFREAFELHSELELDEMAAWSLDHLGWAEVSLGRLAEAEELFVRAADMFRRRDHLWGLALCLHHHGLVALAAHRHATAREQLTTAMELFDRVSNRWGIAASHHHLGHVALASGDLETADRLFRRGVQLNLDLEDRNGLGRSVDSLGCLAAARGDHERAALLLGTTDPLIVDGTLRISVHERTVHDAAVAAVRAVAAERVETAWARGRSAGLMAAVGHATA